MTRILVAIWLLLSLCVASCTTKKAEDQPPNQDAPSSSSPNSEAAESPQTTADSEAGAAPEVVSTPDPAPVKPAPKVAAIRKTKATPKAFIRSSTPKVASSPVASELVAAVEVPAPAPSYRPRSARASGYLCDTVEFVKYEKLHDGEGGFMRGKVFSRKSRDCGYVAVVVRKESKQAPVLTPVASQPLMPPADQWVADAQVADKCEDGILYKFEKNTQTGGSRKTKVGTCPVESAKPDYLNKTIQQVKDDGLIKKGESGSRKKDN